MVTRNGNVGDGGGGMVQVQASSAGVVYDGH